ncbi:uncharacterized protein [Ranitomeya imitator]|uniref:uncharacterized protein n=1 Tax=Ranitomeya imitator TaxID=111125 RepID=UPI0037E8F9F1
MDEILKSEIFVVVHGKTEGVSFEEFGGLFRQVHGYYLNLSNYGYSSMRALLNDMNDLVEVKTINKQPMIRCKSPSRHHVVVSNVNTLPQAKEQVPEQPTVPLPTSRPSPGPAKKTGQAQPTPLFQQKAVKVKSTKLATGKKSKETIKPQYCQTTQPHSPAVKHTDSPQPGSSSHGNTAKSHRFPANQKPPTAKPVPAAPAVNAATATGAAKTKKVSKTKSQNSTFLKLKTGTKIPTRFPNVCSAIQNKKAGLPPTPGTIVNGSPFYTNCMPMVAHAGTKPNVSYASACKSNLNMNQFNHGGQQFPPNNVRFVVNPGVNSSNVPQFSNVPQPSGAEHRPSIQPGSVIKQNIEQLLSQYDGGLSVFQLQKLYLTMFRQPLKFRGSVTLKHLLVELKDVVKTEGLGVQMVVYPGSARRNPSTPAKGDQDAALKRTVFLTKGDLPPREVALGQHSADSLQSQNDKLEEAAQLSFSDDLNLVSGLTTKNGLSQNASEDYSLPQIILHSSGFSFVMEQKVHDPDKESAMNLSNNLDSHNEQKTPSHNSTLNGPEHLQQILSGANASTLLPDTEPHKSLVPQVENTEHKRLQSHNSMNVIGTHRQATAPSLQPSVTFHTENNCSLSDYPALPTRVNRKTKSGLVPVEEPPSKQKSISRNRNKYEQEELSNGRDVQTKNTIEKTSQVEATISPSTIDPTKTDDPCVPGTEQSMLMSSDVQKNVKTHSSQRKQDKPMLQKKQVEDFSNAERIAYSLQETPMQQEAPVEQSKPPNNLEMTPEQEDTLTWQTSNRQVCCIL